MNAPPCPWCASRNLIPFVDGAAHWVLCAQCGGRGPLAFDAPTAWRRWERQPLRRAAWRSLLVLDCADQTVEAHEACRLLQAGLAPAPATATETALAPVDP